MLFSDSFNVVSTVQTNIRWSGLGAKGVIWEPPPIIQMWLQVEALIISGIHLVTTVNLSHNVKGHSYHKIIHTF